MITSHKVYYLGLLHAFIFATFCASYIALDVMQPGVHFKGGSGPFDAMYFTLVTHSTMGYGDITPTTRLAKSIVMMHIILVMSASMYVFRAVQ